MKTLLTLLFTLSVMFSGLAETLSLDDCLQMALANNPDLRKSRTAFQQSRIQTRQAWSGLSPSVSANASSSNSGPVVSEMEDDWSWSLGGSVNQTFYSPGMYSRISLAKKQQTSSEYSYESLEDQIRASVQNVYYQILVSDTLAGVYRANIHAADEQITKMRLMVELGLKRESDLLKSEVQRGTFEAQLVREQQSLAASKRTLNRLMGREPGIPYDILPLDVQAIDIPNFTSAYAVMLEASPALKRFKTQVDIRKLSLRISKEAYLPSVSGSYSYSQTSGALGGPSMESDQVSLRLSLDLFDGFRKHQNVQVSKLDLQDAQLDFQAALRDADETLRNQYKALDTQNRLIGIHETSLASARKDLEVVTEQYAAGLSSILDLTDAQVSVLESESSLLQDLYARKRIEAEIRRLIGSN